MHYLLDGKQNAWKPKILDKVPPKTPDYVLNKPMLAANYW
jgi:hypothetical protein